MDRFQVAAFSIVLLFIGKLSVQGGEPAFRTELLLAKWEEASSKTREFDVTFTRLDTDENFNVNERSQSGRFYWKAPNEGFYEIDSLWLVIWNADGFCLVDPLKKNYSRWSTADMEQGREALAEVENLSGWQSFWGFFGKLALAPLYFADADSVMPLCTKIDAQAIKERFDLEWRVDDGRSFVAARPKVATDTRQFQQIDVLLAADTYEVLAHRVCRVSGERVVHIFEGAKLNKTPADRDAKMNPNLHGFGECFLPPSKLQVNDGRNGHVE